MEFRPDGNMMLAIQLTRTGKSVWVKEAIAGDQRVIAWDPKGEYAAQLGFTPCHDKVSLLKAVSDAGKGPAKIAYINVGKSEFDFFCGVAFNFNRRAQASIILEELAEVTNCGKATGNFGRLVSQGLAFGPKIIGTVQRGQEVSKSLVNNAKMLHIGMHGTDPDHDYITKMLGLGENVVPREKLRFIQWQALKGVVCEGRIDFVNKPRPGWPKMSPVFKMKTDKGLRKLTFHPDKSGLFKQVDYA